MNGYGSQRSVTANEVQADPHDDEDRLPQQIAPGAQEPGDRLTELPDGLGVDVERESAP